VCERVSRTATSTEIYLMRGSSRWPVRRVCTSAVLVLTVLLSFSARVLAQKYVTAYATIPFAFDAGGKIFAAGDYIVDSSVPSFIVIRSKDGKRSTEVPTVVYGDPVKKSEARLIFVKRDGKYVLHELWGVLGRRTMTPELADDSAIEKQTKEVPLTYHTDGAGPTSVPPSPPKGKQL
jgi:hypothetical protein